MNTYNLTYETINDMGFKVLEHHRFVQLGVSCYKYSNIHLILQNWDEGMSSETVEAECHSIRHLLIEMGVNVWNTYFLLCANSDEINDDQAFFIERNSTSLRKFVIRQEYDINRIPFLDKIEVKKVENPVSLIASTNEEDTVISAFLTEIRKINGHTTTLNKKDIKNVVNIILSSEVLTK
jgi:hypothetical protein